MVEGCPRVVVAAGTGADSCPPCACLLAGLPQQQALEKQLSQVHEALAALKDQVAAQAPPQRSFSPTYERAPLMDHLLEVAADESPPKAGPGAGDTTTKGVGALGAVPAPPVGSPRHGHAGTGARPGAGQAGASAGRPSVGPSAADSALLLRAALGAGTGSRAGDGGDSSDAAGSPKAPGPPAKELAEPASGGQKMPTFMEREAARSEKARKGSPHAGAKRKAPDRERHRTPSTPRKATKGGGGKTPGSRVPGDTAPGSDASHAGAERRGSGRGSERRRSHRATSQEETDARAGRHAEKAAHRVSRAGGGGRDSDRAGGDRNSERNRPSEGKGGDRAAKSAGSSGGPPPSHAKALGPPAGNSAECHQARKWDQKAPQQQSGVSAHLVLEARQLSACSRCCSGVKCAAGVRCVQGRSHISCCYSSCCRVKQLQQQDDHQGNAAPARHRKPGVTCLACLGLAAGLKS